jgi:hypothetical protein
MLPASLGGTDQIRCTFKFKIKANMAMRRIFWGFCRNRFLMSPLHYLSSRSVFGFEFAEIFVIEKRLPDSASRGVVAMSL